MTGRSSSTFTANTASYGPPESGASDGGAIDNADHGGKGTVAVSGSTFSANSARTCPGRCSGDGGAIDNGDSGTSPLAVSASTFSANRANEDGGAIANGYAPNIRRHGFCGLFP
jgi:hypothetical protein